MLRQNAIYWAPNGVDQYGDPILELPINIKCRWEDEIEEGLDMSGTETTFTSTVYTDRDVVVGGIIMLGEVADLIAALPPPEEGAHRIRRFDKLPTLRATQWLRTVKL
jgi:hypothetical protein